ncbi:MAG: sulfotransferase family protein [Gammaproteobacteria bacterium]
MITPPRPLFILGSQRSGTTMLRLMVNNHPEIAVPHESAFITEMFDRLHEFGDLAEYANRHKLLQAIEATTLVQRGGHIRDREQILQRPISSYPEFVAAIFEQYALALGKRRWADKTPFYTDKIDTLCRLFPRAQFVHLVRDGRDVALSQRQISWLPSRVHQIAEEWRWKTTICHKVGSSLAPDRYLLLHFEELVGDPQRCLRTLCDFINVEFAPQMLDYHQTAATVVPQESLQWHRNSVKAPMQEKVGEWKRRMPKSDRTIFEQIAGDALSTFGYEREHLRSSWVSRAKNLYNYALS